MANDMVSVIVCTYNQQDTIGRTLESILSQECHLPVEIIIGEDGSTDGTLAVCQTYQKQHPDTIRILSRPVNKGFVSNYFDCLRACRGKYIADCAGDDFWTDRQKLELQVRIMEQDPSVGIVHTNWLRYYPQTEELVPPDESPWECPLPPGEGWEKAILTPGARPAIHLCTALYRNDWVRQAMHQYPQFFDPERYLCEDVQIAFFLARMGKVAYIDRPTLAYSCGATSISNPSSEEKHFHFWANTTRLSYDLAQTFGLRDPHLDRFLQARLHKLLMHAFRSGKHSLRSEAVRLQKEMHIADNGKTLFAKLITLPIVWPAMLCIRKLYVNLKHRR